jgi:exonuclease 3'-5' domain-containing protein 2
LPIRLSDGLNLETDSEEESSEPPPEEAAESAAILSPTAQKRALIAFLKTCKATVNQARRTLRETEKIIDTAIAKDSRVEAAEMWASAFIAENYPAAPCETNFADYARADGHAKFIELRAYHLWHTNRDLETGEVAALLRSPPLKTRTVVNYIFNAVKMEKLPVNDTRYSQEILEVLGGKWAKYKRDVI